MLKTSFSILLLQFIVFYPSISLATCSPATDSDGRVMVEIMDANGKIIYSGTHKTTNEGRYQGFVSDAGVGLKLKSKENADKIEAMGSVHFKAKGTYIKASMKDGSAIAKIGGCQIGEISLLTTFKKKKEPYIHESVIQLAKSSPVKIATASKSNEPKTAVVSQEKPSKPVVAAPKTKANTKTSSSAGTSKDTLVAFGIPLGAVFSKDLFKSVGKRSGRKNSGIVTYDVVPKVTNPYFEHYAVQMYSVDNRIFTVSASKICKRDATQECTHGIKMIGESLDKKYGKPGKGKGGSCGNKKYPNINGNYQIQLIASGCDPSSGRSRGTRLSYNDPITRASGGKKWEEASKKAVSGKASSSTGL